MKADNAHKSHTQIPNPGFVTFNVVLVRKGEAYGRNDCLVADGDMVEFYDSRYTEGFSALGQFVSRYYLSTFAQVTEGLCLNGGVPVWSITWEGVFRAQAWLFRQLFQTPPL